MSKLVSRRNIMFAAVVVSAMGMGYAIGAQPHMTATIDLLRSAHVELVKALPNKGGHRERALRLIEQAIDEVRQGIAFAGG